MNLLSEITSLAIRGIHDMGYNAIRTLATKDTRFDPTIKERAKKQIKAYYKGTTKKGVLTFVTPSGTTPGKFWTSQIFLSNLDKLVKKYKDVRTPREITNLAIAGDLQCNCNCPAFLFWGFKYKAWVKGYGFQSEQRFPKIRNPKLQGSVCKHLEQVLATLPFYLSDITRDLKDKGVFN